MAKDEWRSRLYEAIRNDGRALSAISQAAGLGVNYAEQLMKEDKAITVPVLLRLCEVLKIDAGYLFTGVRLDADLERLLGYAAEAPPEKIQSLVAILKS